MTDVESALKEAKRIYDLDKYLFEKKAIGSQEFEKAKKGLSFYDLFAAYLVIVW